MDFSCKFITITLYVIKIKGCSPLKILCILQIIPHIKIEQRLWINEMLQLFHKFNKTKSLYFPKLTTEKDDW